MFKTFQVSHLSHDFLHFRVAQKSHHLRVLAHLQQLLRRQSARQAAISGRDVDSRGGRLDILLGGVRFPSALR
eukprot:6201055-Pleurochrysis_carterae.AAC.2